MTDNDILNLIKFSPRTMDFFKRHFNRSRRDVENALRRLKSARLVHFNRSSWRWTYGAQPVVRPLSASVPTSVPASTSGRTRYMVLLDGSGSMQHCAAVAKAAVDADMRAALAEDMRPSLYTFGEAVGARSFGGYTTWSGVLSTKFDGYVPGNGPQDWSFQPEGNTPLNDRMVEVLDIAISNSEPAIVIIATDGEENASKTQTWQVRQKVQQALSLGRITVAMLVPKGRTQRMVDNYGIDPSNIKEWNSADLREVGVTFSAQATTSRQAYTTHRASTGQLSMNKGYYAPDLSNLGHATVERQLNDLSSRYKVAELPKEMRIDEFVSEKTGYSYTPGEAFYQLMKKEKRAIEANKEVLLMDKVTGVIYGGDEARNLVGLPPKSSFKTVKIEPGNHGAWEIFIQSHSNNRILPRGTKIAFRK